MTNTDPELFTALLRQVSRSFYPTFRVLPGPLRGPLSLGYLLARSADTIADTEIVPRERRLLLLRLFQDQLRRSEADPRTLQEIRGALAGPAAIPGEIALLDKLPQVLRAYHQTPTADRSRLQFVLLGLSEGMAQDLENFPGGTADSLRAFQTPDQLDQYIYHAAGIVGEFWTDTCYGHCRALHHWDLPAMQQAGIRFGKGLQLINVIRDAPRDLRHGRCYFPETWLHSAHLSPRDLLDPGNSDRFRPILVRLTSLALDYFEVGLDYVLAIPRREVRIRLACLWPLWIGLKTLRLLAQSGRVLDPAVRLRISRSEVYALFRISLACVCFNALLKGYTLTFRDEVEKALQESAAPFGRSGFSHP
ncbi:MAG: squalene/phytoene synthase family protein [Planctomycetes bacterium]|nr:squalene/phytoene synthase family protein [Planctomycetota bacterium]